MLAKKEKINILFIEGAISFGGSTSDLIRIVNKLDKEHYKVLVAALYSGEHVEILKNQLNDFFILDSKFLDNCKFLKVIFIRLYHFLKLTLLIKNKHIDIIHFNNGVYYPSILASKLLMIPSVVHLRSLPTNYHTQKSGISFFVKIFARFVDCFIAVSEAVKNEYVKFGFESKKIVVIGSGISIVDIKKKALEINLSDNIEINTDELIIGTIGRLSWEKGILHLIESMPNILKEFTGIKCFIVGGGPLEKEFKKRINELNLRGHVVLTGRLNNPYHLLSNLDIFVLPSLKEGQGLVVMEAMALGIPVVATRVGGVIELIDNGVDGILIEPANANSISNAVLSLINNPDSRNRLSRSGLIKAQTKFLIEDKVEQIERIYENYAK